MPKRGRQQASPTTAAEKSPTRLERRVDRGRLLWEYRPPRAHPIVYAGLLVFAAVFATGSLENALRQAKPEVYAVYSLPFLAILWAFLAFRPSDTRIHEHGIAPSRPLVLRWRRPFVRWDELAAVYPVSYDVTGAFVSPFASSDGKVTQTGLGLEWPDGRVETVRFTPTRFALNASRSRGYREAIEVVRALFAEQGRALAPRAERFTADERAALAAQARRPFLPFFAIVFLFASAAPVVWVLMGLAGLPAWAAIPVGLVAPLATSLRSYVASRRRNAILNRLSKAAEHERAGAA
jgi:hypothetical protein